MTARERILCTLEHRRPDRTPVDIWIRSEVIRDLATYWRVSEAEVRPLLGVEGWASVGIGYLAPDDWAEKPKRRVAGDFPGANSDVVWHDEITFEDAWGTVRRIGSDRKYVEWVGGAWMHAAEPAEAYFPGLDRLRATPDLAAQVAAKKAADNVVYGGLAMPFKTVWERRGLQQTLMDYLINRPFLEAMYDQVYGGLAEMCRRYARAGVDMIQIVGDISMQDRLMMSPQAWREVDKPRLAHIIAESRKINPDLYWFIHSDGNYEAIIPDLLEIGFNVLNPIQPECMDPVKLKRLYGDRATLHGTGSIQQTLPFGTVEDVRQEVIHRITHCGYNGGLVLAPSNVIQADCPIENVIAFYHTARDFDLSQLPDEAPEAVAAS